MIEDARRAADEQHKPLEQILVERNVLSSADLVLAYADYLQSPPISLAQFRADETLLNLLPTEMWGRLKMLPLAKTGRTLTVAVADPFNVLQTEKVEAETEMSVVPVVAEEAEIMRALNQQSEEESGQGLEDILKDMADESEVELGQNQAEDVNLDEMLEIAEDAPVIRIVNSILIEALRKGVSDIHVEPMEKALRLRYRIDGVLHQNPSPPKSLQPAITSRLKIMSNLDIAERRKPQDGRFKIRALGKEVDMRISFLPTVHGEKIVMRILDKSALAPSLESLGLEEKAYENLCYAISQPHGMICITGPTGSGKTTTLYSALQDLNNQDVNIITVEDPVEYQLGGINQVQADPNVGLTFAAGLRSILRQDPDIVLIGEIRDAETAGIAVQAALTGHLVLSTLHTNDAPGAVARLAYMGIEPFMLSSSLLMTQAQRLFRKLCPVCRKKIALPEDILRRNHLDPDEFADSDFYTAVGCPKCNNIGYKGRGALMEIMLLNEDLKKLILQTTEAGALREAAVRNGMVTLREMGLNRVRAGVSTVEEILRVTSE
ncbi:GspE/PulE family protein [Kiritimatiella glycovorans]|uniref:GspE/PulE family protein n=1 Tax=Kiritimatiella glycovorans TaxID=1307763 RepID=UPI001364C51C|nr:ATPase, T2SS/T4P/T4SS family [Kiritimatiella glycovorans]